MTDETHTARSALDERRPLAAKGRGAISNSSGRYERQQRVAVCDGWDHGGDDDSAAEAEPPRVATTVGIDTSRTIITRNQSPDIPFDRSINPYRGCEHGCIYCFARPSHAQLGLSPGVDFETRLFAKPDAARLLEAALRKPGYEPATIALGTVTDPYQPIEREHRISRALLEVLSAFNHPVSIVTKSTLVTRDLDILASMAERGLVKVAMSVTTLDRGLARRMEPRCPTPQRRLAAIAELHRAGVPVHLLMAPIIPALNDHEIEDVLAAGAAAGVSAASYVLLRLPLEIKDLFQEWLVEHYPLKRDRIVSLVRQTRGGALYRSAWGERQSGTGPIAELIARRFARAAEKNGLGRRFLDSDLSQFRPPPQPGDQLSLL